MKIIDSHIHIGLEEFCISESSDFRYNLCSKYEDVILMMDENEVDQAVIVPIPHRDFDAKRTNEYVLEAYQAFPTRFIPFCRIDDNLENNVNSRGFKGVKLHLLYEDIEIKQIKKELQIIEDAGVPLLLHAKFKNKIKQIEEILKYAPNIQLILAHMGRGHLYTGEQVVENAVGLKKYKNVYMDLSTVGDVQAIVNVCEIIGYNRVLFASDYPFGKNYYGKSYEYRADILMLKVALTEEQFELVSYRNAHDLFKDRKGQVKIRRAKKNDMDGIMEMLNSLNDLDKKYLALKNKSTLIRQTIRSGRHCYIAEIDGSIVGFMRESGRPDNYSLLEEMVINGDYRGRGISKIMLEYYHNAFNKTLAKSNAGNEKMIGLLKKYGYVASNPNAPRIINWIREEK